MSQRLRLDSVPRYGDEGHDVVRLQEALVLVGQNPGRIDGVFLDRTRAALIEIQRANGLEGTGVIGPMTLAILGLMVITPFPDGRDPITRDLQGKKDRHLHPNKRLQIEGAVFLNGEIPLCIQNRDVQASFVLVARALAGLGFHESGGNNMGEDVGEIQGTTGSFTAGGNGDAWCEDFIQVVIAFLEDCWGVESPVLASAHCMTTLRAALEVPGLVSPVPEVGTMGLNQHGSTDSGHAMGILEVNDDEGTMVTAEGNTSFANVRDGDSSGIRDRYQKYNGDLIFRGSVRLYPHNQVPSAA